jgi:thiol-disulfide isomerase/thioredoxin
MYVYDRQFLSSPHARNAIAFGLGQPVPPARQTYAGQPLLVRELTDANFWNIFNGRNRVVVVSFWSDTCRPCNEVAQIISDKAASYSRTTFRNLVNFFQIQWDPNVNPHIQQRFGFKQIPVTYFYYTSTGNPPNHGAPLLEGSLGGGDRWHLKPEEYDWRIKSILRRHGHALIARIILIDVANFFSSSTSLRNNFTSRLHAKFNGLDPKWLSNQLLSFRVEYRPTAPTLQEKQNFGRLDFPIYLLDSSHDETFVTNLMREHLIPNTIQCTSQTANPYDLARDCLKETSRRGCGIPPGTGFRKIGFIKTDRIIADPIGKRDQAQAFLNVTSHELGHMLNRCDHSPTGLMKYPVRLDADMDFAPGDKGFVLGQLLRLRDI